MIITIIKWYATYWIMKKLLKLVLPKSKKVNGYLVRTTRSSGKVVFEHRARAEEKLGRKLKYGEVVHHINGDPMANWYSNLAVMDEHEHIRWHKVLEFYRDLDIKYPSIRKQKKMLVEEFGAILL